MKKNLQETITKFISESKLIEGAENAIFELSEDINNCLILSGEVYGIETKGKINELGKKYGIFILAFDLTVFYDKPKTINIS